MCYVLQPVTKWIQNYFNELDDHLRQEAKQQWKDEQTEMARSLLEAARILTVDAESLHSFMKSGMVAVNLCIRIDSCQAGKLWLCKNFTNFILSNLSTKERFLNQKIVFFFCKQCLTGRPRVLKKSYFDFDF